MLNLPVSLAFVSVLGVADAPVDNQVVAASQNPGSVGVVVADLEDQLNAVLKSRRPEEFKFIADVVAMVEDDTLPLQLVTSTFLWVKNKKQKEKFPWVYFERALRIRAARVGIKLPEVTAP